MTEDIFRTQVRFPARLADTLKARAKEHDVSFNALIVDILSKGVISLPAKNGQVRFPSAAEAKAKVEQGIIDGRKYLIDECGQAIERRASEGFQDAIAHTGYDDVALYPQLMKGVVDPVIKQLESLGYKVELEDDQLFISFEDK